ncbi:sulfotransferase family protein [Rhodobacter aestuarii]|uniref:Sulfotransferase family protein n=1 Tax=Rhodobacter aestuarii TaxID=453582 RepID=A0A1N7NBH7_9RHOB|nr:sulfotransferase family 2 domain-containing protein [Rhodobacter aestuarii]PTV96363.1 sulfotransferase family protein [Rhodobacter aestuarii]SIS95717.1 Sulfotransferase family protein [Rhodobacter aestuarii]
MIVSPGRRYIFVHIPKTGGTALAEVLEARAMADDILVGDTPKARRRKGRLKGMETAGRLWKHTTLAEGVGLYTEAQARDWFTFALVRNPWDRMVSYYHWLRAQSFAHPAVGLAQDLDFTAFVLHPEIGASIAASPYGSYLRLANGCEAATAFIRLEHFAEDVAPLEAHLGFTLAPLPRVNASARAADWRGYYTDETAAAVARFAAADITRFHYAFD